jgi:hypothetical protein
MNDRESKMITLRTDESGKPTVWCDPEIADLVDALNTDKLSTVASCSGHGHRPGRISLKDGRELLVMDSEQVAVVERLFGTDINGQSADDFANAEAKEAVAYGLPNTAITGKKQGLMQVRLDIPSNDQYGGALWVPLYLSSPTVDAAVEAFRLAAMNVLQRRADIAAKYDRECDQYEMEEIRDAIRALPGGAKALEDVCMEVAKAVSDDADINGATGQHRKYLRAIVQSVIRKG